MIGTLIAACVAYTNVAGKVIMAEPVRLDGDKVQVVVHSRGFRENGAVRSTATTNTYSLSLFPPSERKRIKAALGICELPPKLRGLWEEIAAQRRRAEARAKAGKMTSEELAEYNRNLDAAWEHYKGK